MSNRNQPLSQGKDGASVSLSKDVIDAIEYLRHPEREDCNFSAMTQKLLREALRHRNFDFSVLTIVKKTKKKSRQ